MRTTKSLVVVAAWLAASGCMKTQNQASQQPVAATTPPATGAESAQVQQPPEAETAAPPETSQPPSAAGATTAPGMGAMQQAAGVSAHDLVSAALACAAGPSPRSTWAGSSPSATGPTVSSADQECARVAGVANISPQALRSADKSATDNLRRVIDQQAKNENLSGSMHDQLISLYDKGVAALREKSDADAILSRIAQPGATGGGPSPSGATTTQAPSGATTRAAGRSAAATATPPLSSSDAEKLRAHDSLKELVQFAHGSNGGAVATEAEGLAWMIAAERFMTTSQLPPKYKVLAAEPLFDTLLGVPTPSAAKGDVAKIPNSLWSQYVGSAARAARESGAGGAAGIGGGATGTQGGAAAGTPQGGTAARAGRGATTRGGATVDANNWRQIVMLLEQRIDSLAQQLPPSDLRQTLASYALELRSEAVGGGPATPPGSMQQPPGSMQQPPGSMQQPPGSMQPWNRSQGTTTSPPSGGMGPGSRGAPSGGANQGGMYGTPPSGGSPSGGSGAPSGGSAPPSGGSGMPSGGSGAPSGGSAPPSGGPSQPGPSGY